eukprot:CAMPEP_0185851166 /NCGR_PEP_ID=MMETSP1354-20130828/6795_1 /TAXON_ID=708628 /ORGANISM="Erythrolobus madagascarensis, Strain CCMP3276" /LENGTH=262 /DNA_ID=CAMNT_0028552063 /DNA_START=6 /DNA_END=794 /DNA_ORIENTATION=+
MVEDGDDADARQAELEKELKDLQLESERIARGLKKKPDDKKLLDQQREVRDDVRAVTELLIEHSSELSLECARETFCTWDIDELDAYADSLSRRVVVLRGDSPVDREALRKTQLELEAIEDAKLDVEMRATEPRHPKTALERSQIDSRHAKDSSCRSAITEQQSTSHLCSHDDPPEQGQLQEVERVRNVAPQEGGSKVAASSVYQNESLARQVQETRERLARRGEALEHLNERTEEMQHNANEFRDAARALRKKHEGSSVPT